MTTYERWTALLGVLTMLGCGSGGETSPGSTSGISDGGGSGGGGGSAGGGDAGSGNAGGGEGGAGNAGGGEAGSGNVGGGEPPRCETADDCDDGISCTVDTCDGGTCSFANDDALCDDALYCNGDETCDPQTGDPTTGCVAGSTPCDDGVDCTTDTCDEATDACDAVNDDAACDDGSFCNGDETCDPQTGDPTTGCVDGAASPCDDGFSCTVDTCDEATDSCDSTPDDGNCIDSEFCDGEEVCDPGNGDPATGCRDALSPACNDGIDCTDDGCDEAGDTCTHTPNDGLCDDGVLCTGVEFCSVMTGQCETTGQADCNDNVGCTTDFCDVASDACANVAQNSACSDGQFCNGAEICDPVNDCQPGVAVNCGDSFDCTIDSCDEVGDACVHTTEDTACSDGQFCNGSEVCNAALGCIAGAAPSCNDQLDCTADSCDEVGDTCVNAPNDGFCDDSLFCNGGETCDPNAAAPGDGCVSGGNETCVDDGIACTVELCDEATAGCITTVDNSICTNPLFPFCVPALGGCVAAPPCNVAADCDDGNDCNGVETCNVVCQPGTPVVCNDGLACTIDSCNPNGGSCNHVPSDAVCDDGFVCNGAESCSSVLGCVAGTAVDCNDGVGCTFDSCNEPAGTCTHSPSSFACNDGVFCNGLETCDVQNGCQVGTPPSCNDNIACTVDTCDTTIDACISQTDNSLCACGETCDPAFGCGDFCEIKTCQGKTYQCGDCVDNDGDCAIDSADTSCFGVCDNNESGFKGNIPGQNSAPCKQDCYFDGDTGAGNDDCYWSHDCDPNQVPPNFYPEGSSCSYDPGANIPGTNLSCTQLDDGPPGQSQVCMDYCGPLTPNGCDCFGCCEVPGVNYPIWLGSENNNQGSCTPETLTDPSSCKPCEIVDSCFNDCENCEICLGKPTLPPECLCQECPAGAQLCGAPCGTPCSFGFFCQSGCCVPIPG